MPNDVKKVPAAALRSAGTLQLGDNGPDAKTAPVQFLARSAEPINHWWWGRTLHDFSGMKLNKARLPIDYIHDDREVLGYVNHHEVDDAGLHLSGALTPFREDDRASEVLHKMRVGVPYEASIDFGGDGIVIEDVPKNVTVEVNGKTYEGPLTVFRQWPLRGVAVCPYGADANTSTEALAQDGGHEVAVTVLTRNEGDQKMPPNEEEQLTEPSVDEAAVETPEAETTEEETPEVVDAPETGAEATEQLADQARAEFVALKDEFGAEIAAEVFAAGGGREDAMKLALDKANARIAELEIQLKQLSEADGADPVESGEDHDPAADKLAQAIGENRAAFARTITLPGSAADD